MGYFSNGSEGMDYQEHYCSKCIHAAKQDCPVWLLHLLHNGAGCAVAGACPRDPLDSAGSLPAGGPH